MFLFVILFQTDSYNDYLKSARVSIFSVNASNNKRWNEQWKKEYSKGARTNVANLPIWKCWTWLGWLLYFSYEKLNIMAFIIQQQFVRRKNSLFCSILLEKKSSVVVVSVSLIQPNYLQSIFSNRPNSLHTSNVIRELYVS